MCQNTNYPFSHACTHIMDKRDSIVLCLNKDVGS